MIFNEYYARLNNITSSRWVKSERRMPGNVGHMLGPYRNGHCQFHIYPHHSSQFSQFVIRL